DPSFVHEFKMRIRMIIMDYVYELKVKEPEKIEYIIEYQLSALIGMFQLWLEKNESMDENVLADFVEEVSNQGVTTMMTSMLNNKNSKLLVLYSLSPPGQSCFCLLQSSKVCSYKFFSSTMPFSVLTSSNFL